MMRSYRALTTAGLAAAFVAASTMTGFAWEPTKEVEFIVHASPSSTHENAEEIAKIINEQNLFPYGVTVKVIDGARGAKARTYVAKTHAGDPNVIRRCGRHA